MHQLKRMGVTAVGCLCALLVAGGAQAGMAIVEQAGLPGVEQTYNIYIYIKGKKQGEFKGELLGTALQHKFAGLSFQYEVDSLRDPVSGQITGRRQHKPIRIKKAWGAASPQLFTAVVTNEVLDPVVIDFVAMDRASGQPVLDHSITLSNATATSIAQQTEEAGKGQVMHVEFVDFVFQRIEFTDQRSKGTAMDDWMSVR